MADVDLDEGLSRGGAVELRDEVQAHVVDAHLEQAPKLHRQQRVDRTVEASRQPAQCPAPSISQHTALFATRICRLGRHQKHPL